MQLLLDVFIFPSWNLAILTLEWCKQNNFNKYVIQGEERGPNYVGRILEFFETMEGEYYFNVQWFFRAEDTVRILILLYFSDDSWSVFI